jgi:DNA-binding MarR family transcriptional regulator
MNTPKYVNMTDTKLRDPKPGTNLLYLRDEELRQGIELLFFAYRDFTSDPDAILARDGLGRAHHRAIYFIGRRPGITIAELLGTLRITKQSLGRVLKQLVALGYVEQKSGTRDRRQRHLSLTRKGIELEQQLTQTQRERVARAFREAGPEAVAGYRKVLIGLINEEDRAQILEQLDRG